MLLTMLYIQHILFCLAKTLCLITLYIQRTLFYINRTQIHGRSPQFEKCEVAELTD